MARLATGNRIAAAKLVNLTGYNWIQRLGARRHRFELRLYRGLRLAKSFTSRTYTMLRDTTRNRALKLAI
jgi:hypothetical protein